MGGMGADRPNGALQRTAQKRRGSWISLEVRSHQGDQTVVDVGPREPIGTREEDVRLSFVSYGVIIASALVAQLVAAAEIH